MIRAVLDTNMLVSYLLVHRPPVATLIDEHVATEACIVITAPELLKKLDRVLASPKLQQYVSHKERVRFVAIMMALSRVVELPEDVPRICQDPDEDLVIACAVAGQADAIATGDGDLLSLEKVGDIPIVTVGTLLDMLKPGV